MTADLTREQAREQVARAIHAPRCMAYEVPCVGPERFDYTLADAALSVLWPAVEGLRAELAHAHTVIARHVEPKRGAVIDRHCCDTCETKFLDAEVERTGNPSMRLMRFMVVCSACGSKRCPRAADHDLACEADPRGEGHK